MSVDKMTLDKMTLDKMTLDKMTLDKMSRCHSDEMHWLNQKKTFLKF
jgi:hypothetical protein